MNKKLAAFFSGNGMSVEKNRAYGIIQGYEVNAELCNMEIYFPLKIHISFHADESVKNKIAWDISIPSE